MASAHPQMSLLFITLMLQPAAVLAARVKAHARVASNQSASSGHPDDDLGIIVINEDTPPIQKLKIAKSQAFRQMWPHDCGGQSLLGEPLALETNGFVCKIQKVGAHIADLTEHMAWLQNPAESYCCHRQCMLALDAQMECGIEEALRLPQAASKAAEALQKMHDADIEMEQIIVEEEEEDEEEEESEGEEEEEVPQEPAKPVVIQIMELKFGKSSLNFVSNKPDLDADSTSFFTQIKSRLAAILSMKLTALQDRNPRILLCAHASTTNSHSLPMSQARAKTISEAILKENLITEDIGGVGEPQGHVPFEDGTQFAGGRFGSILIKFYEGDKPAPQCQKADLHKFEKYLFKFKPLVGEWTPIETKEEWEVSTPVPPVPKSWQDKKLTIKRKELMSQDLYMQFFKGNHKDGFRAKSQPTPFVCQQLKSDDEFELEIPEYDYQCTVQYEYKHYSWFSKADQHELTMMVKPSLSTTGRYTIKLTDRNLSHKHGPVEEVFLHNLVGDNLIGDKLIGEEKAAVEENATPPSSPVAGSM